MVNNKKQRQVIMGSIHSFWLTVRFLLNNTHLKSPEKLQRDCLKYQNMEIQFTEWLIIYSVMYFKFVRIQEGFQKANGDIFK